MSFEELMSLRLQVGPGSVAGTARYYVECTCRQCSQPFRIPVPIPPGQQTPTRCPLCSAPFSASATLFLRVFIDLVVARLCGEQSARTIFLTGTCANCKSRLRFDAREVCDLEKVYCPHCGFDLGEDGKVKIIEHARQLLGKCKK